MYSLKIKTFFFFNILLSRISESTRDNSILMSVFVFHNHIWLKLGFRLSNLSLENFYPFKRFLSNLLQFPSTQSLFQFHLLIIWLCQACTDGERGTPSVWVEIILCTNFSTLFSQLLRLLQSLLMFSTAETVNDHLNPINKRMVQYFWFKQDNYFQKILFFIKCGKLE